MCASDGHGGEWLVSQSQDDLDLNGAPQLTNLQPPAAALPPKP